MTSLQKQLAAIAATSTHQLDLKAQKLAHGKSLLFEPKVAAAQSFENIYLICYEGYRDLCALDPRFVQFSKSLFSEQSKVEDRTQMTNKENEQLNAVLESFMTMVGPRLLLKPAEKALEWLVRRFRVHEYNTECLVMTYLPYHNTAQFLALLSILPTDLSPSLRFLHPYIESPTNPPPRTIQYTATNTPAFFDALQNYTAKVLQAGHQGPALLAFWSSVTTQAIDSMLDKTSGRQQLKQQQTEELLVRVLRVLNTCMRASNGSDAVTGCYMIVIVLVTKATLEEKVLDSLLEAVALSQSEETLEACLKCLAIVAEERTHLQLPGAVEKRLLKIPQLARTLKLVAGRCCADRLVLGCAMAALEKIATSETHRDIFRDIVQSGLLDSPQLVAPLSPFLQLLASSDRGSAQHSQLLDYASQLSETPAIALAMEAAAKKHGMDLEKMGLTVGRLLEDGAGDNVLDADEDEDMMDAGNEQAVDTAALLPSDIPESSFLDTKSQSFQAVLKLFEQATSLNQTRRFLHAEPLKRVSALDEPVFLTFLMRTWCSSASPRVRTAALRSATGLIGEAKQAVDLRHLIPYLLFALADPSATVRRSAAASMSAVAAVVPGGNTWAPLIYGTELPEHAQPPTKDISNFLSYSIVPVLEECAMDGSFIIPYTRHMLAGTQSSKKSKDGLKTSIRAAMVSFLATHTSLSPLLNVRLRLLPLLQFSEKKTSANPRANIILPMVRDWCAASDTNVAEKCQNEDLDTVSADQGHLSALIPRESESADLIQDLITGKVNTERPQLTELAFDWLNENFKSMRSAARLAISQQLLDLALQESDSGFQSLTRSRAVDTLRSVRLDTASLIAFLESVPSSLEMPEGPPTKKRRRASRNEMARGEHQTTEDVSRVLRRLTLVLELIDSSVPSEHAVLFNPLFVILGELPQLKQQSGSDLVYLQTLIFSSLTPMVNRLKEEKDTTEYQSAVRADIVVDCIRHSTNPQVQNAALALIGSLASWVPDMILHNLMPVFTFIGMSLLRQHDDYSAHVVDQTISQVIPQLASSLRAKSRNFLAGVADLLLSFVAAFEHIPLHRRMKLFSELARTLGPEDSLPAIVALLVDRYPSSKTQRRFTMELFMMFGPLTALRTFQGYLALVEDATKSKRTISETLFRLNDKPAADVEGILNNLLSSLSELAAEEKLRKYVAKAFKRKGQSPGPQETIASIVETIIRNFKAIAKQQSLSQCCSRVLGKCLNLLPTSELTKSAELLLTNPDKGVQIAAIRSVEVQAGAVLRNDHESIAALMGFLSNLDRLLQESSEVNVKRIVLSCMDSIIAQFGKGDQSAVLPIAETISGPNALSSNDVQIRVLSLLCLTSVIDVLGEEPISLLPTILPVAFDYLGTTIDEGNASLHNAVYTLLSNAVERLSFIFSRDYLVPILRLSQRSAAAALEKSCVEERSQFLARVGHSLEPLEIFTAIRSTWTDAVSQGPEAVLEQIELMGSAIEGQSKAKLSKVHSTLFSLQHEMFKLRDAVSADEKYIDSDIEMLEDTLISAVVAMILKLNDANFRPFFVELAAQRADGSITFYTFVATFFDKFKSIVTNYASYILDPASTLLASLAKEHVALPLRTAVLQALQASFAHDEDAFWQAPSHYSVILEPLLAQLTARDPSVPAAAIPAIVDLAAASASTENHRELNAILLKYIRAEEAHTRLASVQCERALTDRLGEEWLALLPEMLPFISEARDDDDESVEREVTAWIGEMEKVLGEDLEGMLQ